MDSSGADAHPHREEMRTWPRLGGALIVIGAVLALVAELIYPRAGDDESKFFAQIAHGARFPFSYLLAGVAALVLAAGLIALCEAIPATTSTLARRAVPFGLALILAQMWGTAPAQRILARDWLAVPESNAISAFWATESVARLDGYLVDAWSIVLFAVIPGLLAVGMWRLRAGPRPLVLIAGIGGGVTVFVSALDLGGSEWDLTTTRTIGAVFMIVWLAAVGSLLAQGKLGRAQQAAA